MKVGKNKQVVEHPEDQATSSITPAKPERLANESRSRRFYQPELDALRFFAFLCVFLHHARTHYAVVTAPSGSLAIVTGVSESLLTKLWNTFHFSLCSGVSLFFFLSAYLITTLLVMEREKTGTIHIQSFYIRRALRIWPLYFAYLLFITGLGWSVSLPTLNLGETLSLLGFYQNWYRIQHPLEGAALLGMLWSISIEEQFYLLCPLIARVLRRSGLVLLCLLGLASSCALLFWFGAHGEVQDGFLRPNTFVQMLFLIGGALTALVLQRRETHLPLALRLPMIVAGLVAWLLGYLLFDNIASLGTFSILVPLLNYLMVLVGVLLIFFAFLGLKAQWIPRPVAYLGKISYGLYIWHLVAVWGVEQTLRGIIPSIAIPVVALIATIAISWASYRWLEKPFLSRKEHFAFVQSRSA